MYQWKKRLFYKRIGILLTMAGYLFFFYFVMDVKKMMIYVQLPLVTYVEEDVKSAKEQLLGMGVMVATPLPVYANETGALRIIEDENTLQALFEKQEAERPDRQKIMEQMERENEDAKGSVSQNRSGRENSGTDEEQADGESEGDGEIKTPAEDGAEGETAQTKDKTDSDANKTDENKDDANENGNKTDKNKNKDKTGKTEGGTEEGEGDAPSEGGAAYAYATEPVKKLDMNTYKDFDTLLKTFYVLDANTYIDASELNTNKLLGVDFSIEKGDGQQEAQEDYTKTENPQILIYHTHSQEGYADSIPGDEHTSVMGAGEELARILSQQYGFRVLHHEGKYDVESRDYAYSEAAPGLEKVLADNPSIEVIIDLHRDGVAQGTRLVTDLNGKPTAQVMLFNGLSRTKSAGEISYLQNENRDGNLAFSFQLQTKMMEYYPGLARRIYLKGYRYNMQYRPRSLLVELGAQTNTVEEIWNALPPLAHCISMVLEGE